MGTEITDAGCATLAAALERGALPALQTLSLVGISASAAAISAVYEARANLKEQEEWESEHEAASGSDSEHEEGEEEGGEDWEEDPQEDGEGS